MVLKADGAGTDGWCWERSMVLGDMHGGNCRRGVVLG